MGPFQRRRNAQGHSADDAVFQWEYTPFIGDDGQRFELLDEQDGKMENGVSEAGARSPAETAHDSVRQRTAATDVESPDSAVRRPSEDATALTAALVPAADSAQTRYLRNSLDAALDRWRAYDEAPSAALTRRGLAALADGTELSADQRALLLRAALYYDSGVLTALQCQDDAELTAIVIAEALTTSRRPPPAEAVVLMRDRDARGDVWFQLLLRELRYASSGSDVRIRRRAVDALWRLQGEYAIPLSSMERSVPGRPRPAAGTSHGRVDWLRTALLALMVTLAVLAAILSAWYLLRDTDQLVSLPAGQYVLPRDGTLRRVATTGFAIQRYEVTNQDYRRCVTSGRCSPPGASAISGVGAYYSDRAYGSFPVVNLTYTQAAEYCEARGMRLPSAAEWSLAAGAAPSTGETLTFPWGNVHELQRTNSLESGLGRPTETGSFSPAGDSPIGAADMGGNVAEWTMSTDDDGVTRIVKGGSYRQSADAARVDSQHEIAANGIGDWIGFRCVRPTTND